MIAGPLTTLLALVALATPPAGGPGPGAASAIASRICTQVQHDLGGASFTRAFHSEAACEAKAATRAQAAVVSCLAKNAPGSDSWRRCIDGQVATAAKALDSHHR